MKKYFALFLAALMLLSLAAGCALTGSDTPADSEATPAPSTTGETDNDTDAETDTETDLDLTAVVADVGDKAVTLGDVKELFDYIVQMYASYGYDITSDSEMLSNLVDDVVNNLVEAELIAVKAEMLGYGEFDEAQQKELEERIEAEIQELDRYYRTQAESEAETDSSVDVDARTMELILEEAAYNMNDENATYEEYVAFLTKDVTDRYMQELMQDDQLKDVALTAEQIQAEYDSLVEEQMTYYAESPEAYKYDEEYYEMSGDSPVAFAPGGYSRILHIFCAYEEELPDEYDANEADMALIEEEYGALALAAALEGNAGDTAKMQELVEQYRALKTANEEMYEAHISAAREKANGLYAELQAGADFATLMKEQSSPDDYSDYPVFAEKGILIAKEYECDADWSDVVKEEFAKLSIGQYSEVFADEDGYHIIFYLADEPAGTVELSSIEEGIRAYLLEDVRSSEWDALVEEWMNDGTVKLHEEVYAVLLDS